MLPLHREFLVAAKRVRKTLVTAAVTTREREVVVEEDLVSDQVLIERVPIGRVVDVAPPVREEGDVTILSVVEEEVIVTRRLILKEEVYLRRARTTQRYAETVVLREQQVAVSRTPIED